MDVYLIFLKMLRESIDEPEKLAYLPGEESSTILAGHTESVSPLTPAPRKKMAAALRGAAATSTPIIDRQLAPAHPKPMARAMKTAPVASVPEVRVIPVSPFIKRLRIVML